MGTLESFGLLGFRLIGGSDYKLIYRHYATLFFVFCVDSSESELGILDLIQVKMMDGWMDGWMEGWMVVYGWWVDGWMDW